MYPGIPRTNARDPGTRGGQQGFVFVISLMFLAAIGLLGVSAVFLTTTDTKIAGNYRESRRAYYQAEAGANYALFMMEQGLKADPPTFSLPANVGDTVSLAAFTPPSGFSFSFPGGLTKTTPTIYTFTSLGTAGNNAKATIEASFTVMGKRPFDCGIFGDSGVTLSGNGYTDSYNSNNGPWTWASHNTNGDVGTNATSSGAISLKGNADVYGDAVVGPGGNPSTGVTLSGNAELHGQKLAASEAKDMTPEPDPGGGTPETLSLSGNSTKIFNAGTYRLPKIKISGNSKAYINGDVTFYVDGKTSISGNGRLIINPGASLRIYASGKVTISGNGIVNNTALPANLLIFGTSTCTSVSVSGNGDLYGAVYAPKASVSVTGNGDIYGSVVGKTVKISGNGNVHYDEALGAIETQTAASDLKLVSSKPGI